MKNITKLSTVALSLLLCTACAASNTSTSKTQSHHPKQTKLTDKQKEEPKNKEAADQEMHPQGAVDLTKYKAKPVREKFQLFLFLVKLRFRHAMLIRI